MTSCASNSSRIEEFAHRAVEELAALAHQDHAARVFRDQPRRMRDHHDRDADAFSSLTSVIICAARDSRGRSSARRGSAGAGAARARSRPRAAGVPLLSRKGSRSRSLVEATARSTSSQRAFDLARRRGRSCAARRRLRRRPWRRKSDGRDSERRSRPRARSRPAARSRDRGRQADTFPARARAGRPDLRQRGFAGAVLADNRDKFAGREFKRHAIQHARSVRIRKSDLDAQQWLRTFVSSGGRWRIAPTRLRRPPRRSVIPAARGKASV